MKKQFFPIFALLCGLLFGQCDVINPEEDIPGFLYIPEFVLTTNESTQGTASQKITDAHVFVAGNNIGIFELPATIPVLATGEQEVQIFAGIRDNGIPDFIQIYPFYERYTTTVNFISEKTDTIFPQTTYTDDTQFIFQPQEGFENNNFIFRQDIDGNEDTKIEATTIDIFEGQNSGVIRVIRGENQTEVGSTAITEVPSVNSPVYLEMNYKTETEFVIGLLGYDSANRIVEQAIFKGANANTEWNKIYFNLEEEIDQLRRSVSSIAYYRVVLYTNLLEGNSLEQADVFLDNIKLVQYQ